MTDRDQNTSPVRYSEFEDTVAFVSGAAGGIGRATALAFAEQGANVVVTDVDEAGNEATAAQIEELGVDALAVTCDVRKSEDVQAAIDATIDEFGRLDYACNNAGVEEEGGKLHELPEAEWDRVVDTDLRGVFLAMKYEIPHVLEESGAIVNVSSGAGVAGFPSSAYTPAKHGVVGLTKAAALQYADTDLRVNAVCPGIIDTEMIDRVFGDDEAGRQEAVSQEPIGRKGRPEEIANAVLWQCSDASSFMIGEAMVVDGGQTI